MIRRLLGSCIGVTKYAWWINRFWKEKELELTYMNPRNIKLFFQQTYHKTADERDYSEGMNRYERQEEDPRISHATMKETKSCEQKKKKKSTQHGVPTNDSFAQEQVCIHDIAAIYND